MKTFFEWIMLFFQIRKMTNPPIRMTDFSGEIQDAAVGGALGYTHNPIVEKLVASILSDIEHYHRYCNEHPERSKLNHFELCSNSGELQEKLPRDDYEAIELEYWVYKRAHTEPYFPDTISQGPFVSAELAERYIVTLKEIIRLKNVITYNSYYIKSYPKGRRPYELRG